MEPLPIELDRHLAWERTCYKPYKRDEFFAYSIPDGMVFRLLTIWKIQYSLHVILLAAHNHRSENSPYANFFP